MSNYERSKREVIVEYEALPRDDVDIGAQAAHSAIDSSNNPSAHPSGGRDEKKSTQSHTLSLDEEPQGFSNVEAHRFVVQSNILKLWWSELTAFLLALVAFVGLLCLVLPYNERRRKPNWPTAITLNTVISILTVLLRAGLVYSTAQALSQKKWTWFNKKRQLYHLSTFDRATRGPIGAFLLLFDTTMWDAMSALGAILMILTVAVGPFAQQLLSFESCQLPSQPGQASLPRLAMYADDLTNGYELVIYDAPAIGLQASVFAGIYAPQANAVPVTCPSGNCSFAEYRTVGYCSECHDISDQLITTGSNVSYDGGITDTMTNYTLSSGTHTFQTTYLGSVDMISKYRYSYEIVWAQNLSYYSSSCTQDDLVDPSLSWRCQGYGAANCTLQPCVKTYSAEVKRGIVTETLLRTANQYHDSLYSPPMVDVPCLTDAQRQKLIEVGYQIDDSTDMLPYFEYLELISAYDDAGTLEVMYSYVGNYTTDPRYDGGIVPAKCLYQFSNPSNYVIDDWLRSILQGNVTVDYGGYANGTAASPFIGSDIMFKMYNRSYTSFGLVDSLFRNISDGITTNWRQLGNTTAGAQPQNIIDKLFAGNQPAYGIELSSDVCVHLRWLWLLYPATLLALAAAFLIFTMLDTSLCNDPSRKMHRNQCTSYVQSHWRPTGVWKSSLLPLMYHGLEDKTLRADEASDLCSLDIIDEAAKATSAKLTQTEHGWKFVKVD